MCATAANGGLTPIRASRSGHAFDDRANDTQYVFDRQDVRTLVKNRAGRAIDR